MSKDNPRPLWEGHRQRLRQRVEREGWDALRPHEMVELVLNRAVPRQNLSDVARRAACSRPAGRRSAPWRA